MAPVVASSTLRRAAVLALRTVAVAACYYGAGRLGLLRRLTVEDTVFTPVWPPTGVALTCLLIVGLRAWAGIALGCFFVILHLSGDGLHPSMLANLAGNTLAPVCAYLLLRRVGFRTDLTRLRDGVALVFLAALTAMLISSTTGAGTAVLTGALPADGFWPVWVAWWVGDAMGVLIVTPLLLTLYRARRPFLARARWKEAVALAGTACVIVPVATHNHVNMLFLTYPVLIWAALRFELAGSMLCVLFASVLATVAATNGVGPFDGLTHVEVMLKLQAFNGATALTALLLSAVITEQRNTRRSVERACEELAEVLEHLTASDRTYPPDRSSK
ncbi:MASE1 domain-containing protein [Streptomyces roseirectus]|uniref:MASE1 domain-containing protein n=1 Tax=Streptomyces roseirectus TaxID=2768066 RepID=A0A7H0I6I5_9ACTN|nr:MASE1 domain-containing protein [Streptomyces roseirectus]QNP68401.1 MASE1 domain-containing protein [Streptomyces roseirectus]